MNIEISNEYCCYVILSKEFEILKISNKAKEILNNTKDEEIIDILHLNDEYSYINYNIFYNNSIIKIKRIDNDKYITIYLCNVINLYKIYNTLSLCNSNIDSICYLENDNIISVNNKITIYPKTKAIRLIHHFDVDKFKMFIQNGNVGNKLDIRLRNNNSLKYKRIYYIDYCEIELLVVENIDYEIMQVGRFNAFKTLCKKSKNDCNCITSFFINLSNNSFYPLFIKENYKTKGITTYDQLLTFLCEKVYALDKDYFQNMFSRQNILSEYMNGTSVLSCNIRLYSDTSKEYLLVNAEMKIIENYSTGCIEAIFYISTSLRERTMSLVINKLLELKYDFIAVVQVKNLDMSILDKDKTTKCKYFDFYKKFMSENVDGERKREIGKQMEFNELTRILHENRFLTNIATIIEKDEIKYKKIHVSFLDNTCKEIIIILIDVTKTVQGENERKRLLQEALDKAKIANEAKSYFISQISHDIRTPMNGIMGLITMSLDFSLPTDIKHNLQTAYDSSVYLLDLINNTIELSKIENGKEIIKNIPFNIYQTTVKLINLYDIQVKSKGINLSFDFDGLKETMVIGDKVKYGQIISNILFNSIKYTEKNGNIKFLLEESFKRKMGDDYIKVIIEIRDDGIGIDKKFLPNIFNPYTKDQNNFFSSDSSAGLGLTIVKKIIDQMNGKISINSEVNVGTQVMIELDYLISSEKVIDNQNYVNNFNFKGKNILLCDDDKLNIVVGVSFLEKVGCNVKCAYDGLEALSMFIKEDYDLIFMDIKMPKMNGYDACKEIRKLGIKNSKSIPIIALSANAFVEDRIDAKDSGLTDYLTKPIMRDKLYELMSKYL